MNRAEAYRILEIDPNLKNVSAQDLKKKYYLMALKYHPDKNGGAANAVEQFQKVKDAYDFLCDGADASDTDISSGPVNYFVLLLKHVLKRKETIQIIQKISEGCIARALELFAAMDISHMIYLHDTIKKYHENIKYFFDNRILTKMEELIKEKTANSRVIVLHPTIDNLLDCLLYRGGAGGADESGFIVPLWHHELTYELPSSPPNRELIVKCEPDLPDGITIDDYNNIHVYLPLTIEDIFDKIKVDFYVGEKIFTIMCEQLRFYSYQRIVLRGVGIPRINHDNIFDVSQLGDIIVTVAIKYPII